MPRRLVPVLVAAVITAVGAAVLGYGILLATMLAPPTQTVGQVSAAGVPVVETATGVLELDGARVDIQAVSTSGAPVFLGIARADDVSAYLGAVSRLEVTRVAGDGRLTLTRVGKEPQLPNPARADIWVARGTGSGSASLTWPDAPGRWRVVVAADGSAAAPDRITFVWARQLSATFAAQDIALGVLLVVGGVVGLFAVRRRSRRGRHAGGDDGGSPGDDGGSPGDDGGSPRGDGGSPGDVRGSARRGTASGTPASTRSRTRFAVALGVSGLLALGLAGCSTPPRGAAAMADPTGAHPVVVPRQAQDILAKVTAGVIASARATTANALGTRLVGPERGLLASSLKLPAKLRPTRPATDVRWQRLLVPAQTGWPRWFAAVGSTPSQQTPVIWVVTSPTAREPYGLWGELVMLPGAALPEVPRADLGASALPPRATGLLVAPADVATQYADVLTAGNGSRYARTFAVDVFRDQVLRKIAGDRVQLRRVRGTVTARHTVQGDPLALRTVDGGAVVIAALTETYTAKVPQGAGSVKAGDPVVAALAGRSSFTKQVVQTSTELVAFFVPPSGSPGGRIRVVAAAKAHLSAVGA